MYLKGKEEASLDGPPKIVHEIVNPRWELCVTTSENGFQQASFVNSIATTKVTLVFLGVHFLVLPLAH